MRVYKIAAIAAFVCIPAAQAHTMVWFETINTMGNPGWSGGSGGAPGTILDLYCDTTLGPGVCTWQIQVKAALGSGGISSWSLDLRSLPNYNISVTNPQIPAGTPFNNPAIPGTPGSGLSLLTFAAGQTFPPVQPQTLTLLTFTMQKSFTITEQSISGVIQGGPSANGSIVWANDTTGDYEIVQFGPNPPVPGVEGTMGLFPLMLIRHPIPEPASLSLLAVGAVVCFHRRRGSRIDGGG